MLLFTASRFPRQLAYYNIGGLLSVGGGLDTGGWDEPFGADVCVPEVAAGLAILPGADVAAGELGLLCAPPETPPVGPGVGPVDAPGTPLPLPIGLPLTPSSTLRFC